MSVTSRPQKITFADMREQGARGILVCCADYTCSHSIAQCGPLAGRSPALRSRAAVHLQGLR
jgi:hypothetical protein